MARSSTGMLKVNFYMEPTVLDALKWLAKARGTTYSELVRKAARQYVVEEIQKEQEDIAVISSTKEASSG